MERKPWVKVTTDRSGEATWRAYVPVGASGSKEVAAWKGRDAEMRAQAWLFNFGWVR
jgi:hypothetical protein